MRRGVGVLGVHARDLRQLVWCVPWSAPMRAGCLVRVFMIVEGGAAYIHCYHVFHLGVAFVLLCIRWWGEKAVHAAMLGR